MTTTIRIKRETKKRLEELGKKGESFDDIINNMIHQRNILMIHSWANNALYEGNLKVEALKCFKELKIPLATTFNDCGLNGEGIIPFTMDIFKSICDIATDEDFVGSAVAFGDSDLSLAEAITNVYCLMYNISAPTWSLARANPCVTAV